MEQVVPETAVVGWADGRELTAGLGLQRCLVESLSSASPLQVCTAHRSWRRNKWQKTKRQKSSKWKEQNQTGQEFLPLNSSLRNRSWQARLAQSCPLRPRWPWQSPSPAANLKPHRRVVMPALGTRARNRASYNTAAAPAQSQVGRKLRAHSWSRASPAQPTSGFTLCFQLMLCMRIRSTHIFLCSYLLSGSSLQPLAFSCCVSFGLH